MEHNVDLNYVPGVNQTIMPLSVYVRQTLEVYLAQMNDHEAVNMYSIVISEVEKTLLETILTHTGHNQTKCAKVLGLSRSTLRKKMEHYRLS